MAAAAAGAPLVAVAAALSNPVILAVWRIRYAAFFYAMNVKETVILALKLARRNKETLVVGYDSARWTIMPLSDARSDQLMHAIIITPKGFRYPEDEMRIADLVSQGL